MSAIAGRPRSNTLAYFLSASRLPGVSEDTSFAPNAPAAPVVAASSKVYIGGSPCDVKIELAFIMPCD